MAEFSNKNNTSKNIGGLFIQYKPGMRLLNLFNEYFNDIGWDECYVWEMKDFNQVKFSSNIELLSLTKELKFTDSFYIEKNGEFISFAGLLQLYSGYLSHYEDGFIDWLNENERDLYWECYNLK